MPAQHQWLVDPTAILLRHHTALMLCTEPRCPKVARYLLQFPRQDAVAYCHPHTKAAVRRATGQDQDLRTMLARTDWPCVRPFLLPRIRRSGGRRQPPRPSGGSAAPPLPGRRVGAHEVRGHLEAEQPRSLADALGRQVASLARRQMGAVHQPQPARRAGAGRIGPAILTKGWVFR